MLLESCEFLIGIRRIHAGDQMCYHCTGFKIFFWTHSSCRTSGLKLLLALNQVVLILSPTFGTIARPVHKVQSIKSWDLVQVLNRVLTVAVLLWNKSSLIDTCRN